MASLKDVFIKAGIKTARQENERKKPLTKKQSHQAFRNFCEHCQQICPDVELYFHKNRLLGNAQWLCIKCADDFLVPDLLRQTAQSESSRKKIFRRYAGGPMKKIIHPK